MRAYAYIVGKGKKNPHFPHFPHLPHLKGWVWEVWEVWVKKIINYIYVYARE